MRAQKRNSRKSADDIHISESGDGESSGRSERKFTWVTTISSILIALATLATSVVVALMYHSNYTLNRMNQNLALNENPHLEYINDGKYEITLVVQQGGISRAILVNFTEEGVVYSSKSSGITLGRELSFEIGTREIYVPVQEVDSPGRGFGDIITLRDISEFALVLQDTRNEWHVFYFLIRPPVYFDSGAELVYRVEMWDPSTAELIGSVNHSSSPARYMEEILIIDAGLINQATVVSKLENFPEQNEFSIFEDGWEMQAESGERAKGDPRLTIPYTLPRPDLVFERIQQILKDIN